MNKKQREELILKTIQPILSRRDEGEIRHRITKELAIALASNPANETFYSRPLHMGNVMKIMDKMKSGKWLEQNKTVEEFQPIVLDYETGGLIGGYMRLKAIENLDLKIMMTIKFEKS